MADGTDIKLVITAEDDASSILAKVQASLEASGQSAEKIGKVRGPQELIDQFSVLKRQTVETATALDQAQSRAQELGQQMAEADKPTAALAAEFDRAKKQVNDAKDALQANQLALQKVRSALAAAGVETNNLATAQIQLRNAQREAEAALQAQLQLQKDAAAAEREHADEEERLARIVARTQEEQRRAAQETLAAEKSAYAEAEAAAKRYAAQANPALKSIGTASDQATAALSRLGIRSEAQIRADILAINQDLTKLAANATVSGAEFDRAWASGQERIAELQAQLDAVPDSLDDITSSADEATDATDLLAKGFALFAAIYGTVEVGQEFIEANMQLEALRRTLTMVTGSTAEAEKQIAFLRETANQSGVQIGEIAESYSRFAASASASSISMETVNRTFASVTRAAGALGVSSADASGALDALGQMASKGTVSMEELRQQLGDRLPAVLTSTAQGLGITQTELVNLVSTGQLVADEHFFDAFANGLTANFGKAQGEVRGLGAEWARFRNQMTESYQAIGDTGTIEVFGTVLKGLGVVLTVIGAAIAAFCEGVLLLGKTIGNTVGDSSLSSGLH